MDPAGRLCCRGIEGGMFCEFDLSTFPMVKMRSGGLAGVLLTWHQIRYYHYIDLSFNPLYLDSLKLMGWNYIKYVQGWPVLTDE